MMKFVKNFQKKQTTHLQKTGGFSIIEVLVAVAIATITLGSFSTAVVISLKGYQIGKEYNLATHIAQEGMELAVNKRDNHINCVISSNCPISHWQDNLIGTFEVDISKEQELAANQTFTPFSSNHYICVKGEGNYGYCSGGNALDQNFTRKVTITAEGNDRARVVAEVSWESRNGPKTITFEEMLFGPNN